MLLSVITVLSYSLMVGIDKVVAQRWKDIIALITSDNPKNPDIPSFN